MNTTRIAPGVYEWIGECRDRIARFIIEKTESGWAWRCDTFSDLYSGGYGQKRDAVAHLEEFLAGNRPEPAPSVYTVSSVRVHVVREPQEFTASPVKTPRGAAALIRQMTEGDEREKFILLCMDTKMHCKAVSVISIGDLASSIVHPREVFRVAIVQGASSIIVGHNHPSGHCAQPSREDIAVTRRLIEAGAILSVNLEDHIIVANGCEEFVSMKQAGYI